jgi:hypothetical protein
MVWNGTACDNNLGVLGPGCRTFDSMTDRRQGLSSQSNSRDSLVRCFQTVHHSRVAKYVLAASLVFAAACGTLGDKMRSWVGQPRDKLVRVWGPPDKETPLGDGGTSLLYVQQSAGGYAEGTQNGFSGVYSAGTCRMVFNLDSAGIVRSGS